MSESARDLDTTGLARQLLAQAAQRDVGEVPDDASAKNWDGWDSLAHMRLILAMEAHLGHELPSEAIVEIENLDHIARHLGDS